MVVVVASDALLDSPGRLFWPIILVESGRVEAHAGMPHAGPSATSFLLSTLPSHISNAISRVVRCVRARPIARLTDQPTALH